MLDAADGKLINIIGKGQLISKANFKETLKKNQKATKIFMYFCL